MLSRPRFGPVVIPGDGDDWSNDGGNGDIAANSTNSSVPMLSRPRFGPVVVPGDGDDQSNDGGDDGNDSDDGSAGCGSSNWLPLGGAANNVADDEGSSVGEPVFGS